MEIERKLLGIQAAEFKFDGETGEFEGYASVFNGIDSYGDTIAPGAYKRTLGDRERPIRMRWNHYGPVIGKWIELREDERGLLVRGQLTPGHSVAKDVHASLKHGAIDGLSIGYYAKDYEEDEDGKRLLKDIELVEISVVEEPADNAARISGVKDRLESAETMKDFEKILRDGGFSWATAKALVSRMKSVALREAESKNQTSEMVAVLQRFKTPTSHKKEYSHE